MSKQLKEAEELIEKLYKSLLAHVLGVAKQGSTIDPLDSYETYRVNWKTVDRNA